MVDTHDDILELMVEVADRVIRPRFRALSGNDIDEKSPGDYVTVADRESEKLLTAALLARNPGCLVVGEEASYADPSIREGLGVADLAYTVDPVDGTGNFVKGSPDYAVMIAEIRRSEVTRSWIWQPEAGRAYVAERGAGVTCNGEPMTRVEALTRPPSVICKVPSPLVPTNNLLVTAKLDPDPVTVTVPELPASLPR